MAESEDFLRSIWEHPQDDTPRLAYADWLELRGDAHGEFIRIQIELTRGGRDRLQELGLRQRERALLERFGPTWAEPVLRQGLMPWFRRGFRQPVERGTPSHPQPQPHRVQILYPWRVGGLTLARELPFVVGVLADLAGQRRQGRPPLRQRPFLTVDRHSFDAVLASIRPELHLELPAGFADRMPARRLDLHFERLADFDPNGLVERMPELRQLLQQLQSKAAEGAAPAFLAALDRQLSLRLAAVLHHPHFQRLESTWRGLHYLVQQSATGEDLKIRALDVTRQELVDDLSQRRPLEQSDLFQKIYQQEYGHVDGEPYGVLIGDYEFSHRAADVQLLSGIAAVAAAAHAPFIAGASSRLFQVEHFTRLPGPRDLRAIFQDSQYAAWNSFRDSEDSRYVALTLPRVRAPLPHRQDRAGYFRLVAYVDDRDYAKTLWINAAWAFAARITDAFAKYGWFARTHGVHGGGRVEGLPGGTSPADDGSVVSSCPTEIAISDRRDFDLSNLGVLPLLYSSYCKCGVFISAQSCQKPKQYFNAEAELPAKIKYTLFMSRFAHYLKGMARDLLAASVPLDECQHVLGEWLRQYSLSAAEFRRIMREEERPIADVALMFSRPVRDVGLELRPSLRPSGHEVAFSLIPYLQVETIIHPLCLVFPVPRLN
jgi:type VI secretion system protein ImpC